MYRIQLGAVRNDVWRVVHVSELNNTGTRIDACGTPLTRVVRLLCIVKVAALKPI